MLFLKYLRRRPGPHGETALALLVSLRAYYEAAAQQFRDAAAGGPHQPGEGDPAARIAEMAAGLHERLDVERKAMRTGREAEPPGLAAAERQLAEAITEYEQSLASWKASR